MNQIHKHGTYPNYYLSSVAELNASTAFIHVYRIFAGTELQHFETELNDIQVWYSRLRGVPAKRLTPSRKPIPKILILTYCTLNVQ